MIKVNSLDLPDYFVNKYSKFGSLTPIQEKAVGAGLLSFVSLLVCAPTASGKTLVATMAICQAIKSKECKAIYIVPLKSLAYEKFNEYKNLFEGTSRKVAMSTGDLDSKSGHLADYDLLILTSEKLDSLLRHKVDWIHRVKSVIIDEIHLLNDPSRGPTLEIILTMLMILIKPQIVGLSATIGNPKELACWLGAKLVKDSWRPVELKQGIYLDGKVEYY
jgi:helicase